MNIEILMKKRKHSNQEKISSFVPTNSTFLIQPLNHHERTFPKDRALPFIHKSHNNYRGRTDV